MSDPLPSSSQRKGLFASPARATMVGIIFLALIFLLWQWPTALLLGYLAAWTFWLGRPIGTLAISLIHRLTGGDWGVGLLDHDSPRATSILKMAALALPVLVGMHWLYPWLVHHAESTPDTRFREAYLTSGFFIARSVVYFVTWTLIAHFGRRTVGSAAVSLLLLIITGSLAEFDWLATLSAEFYSTLFGLYVLVAFGLTALCILILSVLAREPQPPIKRMTDWGNLLLAFVMVHGYLAFSHFLIIWSGNLPREIGWYAERMRGPWGATGLLLIVVQLFLPLGLLLNRKVKRHRNSLAATASIVLAANWIEAAWLVIPSLSEHDVHAWQTGLSLLVMIAVTAAIGLLTLPRTIWLSPRVESPEAAS